MRNLALFVVFAMIASVVIAYPIAEDHSAQSGLEAYLDVDGQGHENLGERQARQFGYPGFGGGYTGGLGGYPGGFGGGYGGYGGYGGHGFGGGHRHGGFGHGGGFGYPGGYGGGFYG